MSGGKELVLSTLRQATSQEASVLKPAEKRLQSWETEPGFYATLIEVSFLTIKSIEYKKLHIVSFIVIIIKMKESILILIFNFQIFSQHALEVNVRWIAILYFKNGVDRYWRKTAPNAINEEEKVIIVLQLIFLKF